MILRRILIVIVAVLLSASTAWAALALLAAGHEEGGCFRTSLAVTYALASLAVLRWLRPYWRALAVWGAGFAAILGWWSSLQPSDDRDWQPDVAKLAWAETRGDLLTFHNVRNTDYRSETDFTTRYDDRVYRPVEAPRRRPVHVLSGLCLPSRTRFSARISTVLLRSRSLSRPASRKGRNTPRSRDSSDITRSSTSPPTSVTSYGCAANYRGEQVYLYRLKATPEEARAVLMDYVATMNALVKAPEFYNALLDNCTTSIRHHVTNVDANAPPVDWRLLANGYGDQMLYERGSIDTRLPFAELRERSHINARARAFDQDSGFSEGIRAGLPDPRSVTTQATAR